MTGSAGEFYSARDADSDGQERKYYVWDHQEVCEILGEEKGKRFCRRFGMTKQGNFEGRRIPNLLNGNEFAGENGNLNGNRILNENGTLNRNEIPYKNRTSDKNGTFNPLRGNPPARSSP